MTSFNLSRSDEMWFAGYALSRLSASDGKPPEFLGVKRWNEAYDVFFDAVAEGRDRASFRNSLKNVRDAFDAFIDESVRAGWRDAQGNPPPLSGRIAQIIDVWDHRSDNEVVREALAIAKFGERASLDVEAAVLNEGGVRFVHSRAIERNPKARNEAIRVHGKQCQACGFDFESFYGAWGEGFVEVHHLSPLADGGDRITNPKTDLAVLCSNCHRMAHRRRGICLTLDELRTLIARARLDAG